MHLAGPVASLNCLARVHEGNTNMKVRCAVALALGIASGALPAVAAGEVSDYDDMLRRGLVFDEVSGQFLSVTSNIGKVEVKGLKGSLS